MKRIFSVIACLLALLMIAAPVSVLSFAAASGSSFVNAVDFSDLPTSTKAYYNKDCALNTSSAIFSLGIMLDTADTIGIGTDKTNFKGFRARDIDGDSKTDTLQAVHYNNQGMRFTFGVDLKNDWSKAEAVVLHIDNSVNTSWQSWQSFNIKLISGTGTKYALKTADKATGIKAMFIDEDENSLTNRDIAQNEYAFMPGNKSGYVIIPVSAFADSLDLKNITAISFDASSNAACFTSFKEIGFTENINGLLTELIGGVPGNITLEPPVGGSAVIKVGDVVSNTAIAGSRVTIEATADSGYTLAALSVTSADGETVVSANGLSFIMPSFDVKLKLIFDKTGAVSIPKRIYGKLMDLSVLNPGDYRDMQWVCNLDTSTEIYTKGILVNKEPIGHGAGKVNFHGFWALDTNGDNVTDKLKSHPYDDTAMRFTLGFNNASAMPENREALIVKVDNLEVDGSSWKGKDIRQGMMLTLNDKSGASYSFKDPSKAGDSVIKIIDPDDFSITEFSPKTNGNYAFVPIEKTSWIVIPMELFDGINGGEELTSLSFEVASTWNVFTAFHEIGVTSDVDEFESFLTGKTPRYGIETAAAENGTLTTDVSSAREGTAVQIITAPADGYIVDKVTVTEKVSGKAVVATKSSFVMPACDVTVSVSFKLSPYNSVTRLDDVYTVTQDFSTVDIVNHIDWNDGPDLTPLIEQGALLPGLNRGFKEQGITNCFNGNGIYIQDDGLGFGTSLKLWTHDNRGLSMILKSKDVLPDTEYEGVVLHIHTTLKRQENIPALSVTLYNKDENGAADLDNPIKPKDSSVLYGTTVYLVNDETGEVTERSLGYSPEQSSTLDNNAKYYSQFLVPDGFEGYVLIPYSYFSRSFETSDIAGIRLDYNISDWEMYADIYDVGFTQSISNFVRIASLGNYNQLQLVENTEDIEAGVFTKYKNTERTLTVTVLKDYLTYYIWKMNGLDIEREIPLNTDVFFGKGSEKGVDKFYSDAESAVYLEIPQSVLPGKMTLSLDVSWDFYDETTVRLYTYDPTTGKMTDTGRTAIVVDGFVAFDFTAGGKYLIAEKQLTRAVPVSDGKTEAPKPEISETVTDTFEIQETTGHYETVTGDKKYKTVRTKRFVGYETWFIVMIVVIAAVVVAGIAVTTVIIVKNRRTKSNV